MIKKQEELEEHKQDKDDLVTQLSKQALTAIHVVCGWRQLVGLRYQQVRRQAYCLIDGDILYGPMFYLIYCLCRSALSSYDAINNSRPTHLYRLNITHFLRTWNFIGIRLMFPQTAVLLGYLNSISFLNWPQK